MHAVDNAGQTGRKTSESGSWEIRFARVSLSTQPTMRNVWSCFAQITYGKRSAKPTAEMISLPIDQASFNARAIKTGYPQHSGGCIRKAEYKRRPLADREAHE
jgi:hypothetical protein